MRHLAEFCDRSPELVSIEEVRQYFIHLKNDKKVARQTSTQALCAIKMFWEKTLKRSWPHEVELVRANPQTKLPVIPGHVHRARGEHPELFTQVPRQVALKPLDWMGRFLQHVLPPGFARVRTFGWLHPAAKVRANRVRALLREKPLLTPAEQQAWQPPEDDPPPSATSATPAPAQNKALNGFPVAQHKPCSTPQCLKCQRAMRLVGTFARSGMIPALPLLLPNRPP